MEGSALGRSPFVDEEYDMRKFIPIAVAAAMTATPAMSQLVGGGLVVVNISNVANNIARDLDVNVSNIPVTVQVPVGIAAAVCGVNANVLAKQKKTGDSCEAKNNNAALNKIVQRQLTNQQ
jgi:hypothetical protein